MRLTAESTRVAFVCGHPIKHSRSPVIHRHWLSRYGIEGDYRAIDVAPGNVMTFLQSMRRNGFVGGNITIPHKETVFHAVHSRDGAASAIGAVNTIWFDRDKLIGGNTDAYGFAKNLSVARPDWKHGETAIVLGAGGASRAIVHAIDHAGYRRIHVLNRTVGRAEKLVSVFSKHVTAGPLDDAGELLPQADLIVNTTSVGMDGEGGFGFTLDNARDDAIATDAVYIPLVTPFLQMARDRGLSTVDGLGMLLHQASPGFARWFGVEPAVDQDLRNAVIADMERPH